MELEGIFIETKLKLKFEAAFACLKAFLKCYNNIDFHETMPRNKHLKLNKFLIAHKPPLIL